MSALIHYESTLLQGSSKQGRIRCDPDGYYDVLAGGFDAYNSTNAFYTWESARPYFEGEKAIFRRRVKNGALFGEDGHPTKLPGMTPQEYIVRILTVDADRRSHHIKDFTIDPSLFTNKHGAPIQAVWLRIKPMGARAQVVADSLENPHINTAFSIRCLTKDTVHPYTGIKIKTMLEPVTFDYVDEPGISFATKYSNPSLEAHSLKSELFDVKTIGDAIDYVKSNNGLGLESQGVLERLEAIKKRAGSGLVLPTSAVSKFINPPIPKSSNWR